jgi:hypothetical protein
MKPAERRKLILQWLREPDLQGHPRTADCMSYDFEEFIETKLDNLSMKKAMKHLKELEDEGKIRGVRLATGVPFAGSAKHIKVYSV